MTNNLPSLVDETRGAEILCQKVATLRKWRVQGKGPRFVKMGSAVRYDLADLTAYVESRKVDSTSAVDALKDAKPRPLPGTTGRPKKLRPIMTARALGAR
jgi:hypothetical protein